MTRLRQSLGLKRCVLSGIIFPIAMNAQAPAIGQNAGEGQPHQPPQVTQRRLSLEELERMALDGNPSVAQAAAGVRAAAGRRTQAGLYPNPVIGATGDEISPGPVIRGGEYGAFVEQRVVTAGKLGLSRKVAEQEQVQAEAMAQAQRYRVLNTVRTLYYEALGAERLVRVRTELADITRQAAGTSRELLNVGAADQPDLLEAEIEAERSELDLAMAKTARQRIWRQLAAAVGKPSLELARLEGDLEDIPKLDLDSVMATLVRESPEIRISQAAIAREELALQRARVETRPDIVARGGLRYNRELLEVGQKPVGLEGFFDVGIEIPLFNRNQGNVAVARANLERARLEVERVKLSLHDRLARVYQEYQDALLWSQKYRDQLVPRARRAYELYLGSFKQMAAAYPQVLIAQRNLSQLQEGYTAALVNTWRSVVEIRGLLLTGGLEQLAASGAELTQTEMRGETRSGVANNRERNIP